MLKYALAVILALSGCSSSDADGGGAGQKCRDDGTCNAGLYCASGTCAALQPAGSSCQTSFACEPGLQCVKNRCAEVGAMGEPCVGGCDPPLQCVKDVCADPGKLNQPCRTSTPKCDTGLGPTPGSDCKCAEAGADGQPCFEDATCDSATILCKEGMCAQAGGDGQPCLPDSKCNSGFACVADKCVAAGAQDQPCLPGGTCSSPLECSILNTCTSAGGENQLCLAQSKCDSTDLTCHLNFCKKPGTERAACDSGSCNTDLYCVSSNDTCVATTCTEDGCLIKCSSMGNMCNDGFHCRATIVGSDLGDGYCMKFPADAGYSSWKAGLKPCSTSSDCGSGSPYLVWCVSGSCYDRCAIKGDVCPESVAPGFESKGPIQQACENFGTGKNYCVPWSGPPGCGPVGSSCDPS